MLFTAEIGRFTPPEAVIHFQTNQDNLRRSSQEYKQSYEARVVGLMLLLLPNGFEIMDLNKNSHIILLDPRIERAPDVWLTHPNRSSPVGIEVVSYTSYSRQMNLFNFLGATKSSPPFAYPEGTIILCHSNIPMVDPHNTCLKASKQLNRYNPDYGYPALMLHESPETGNLYLAKIFPNFQFINHSTTKPQQLNVFPQP